MHGENFRKIFIKKGRSLKEYREYLDFPSPCAKTSKPILYKHSQILFLQQSNPNPAPVPVPPVPPVPENPVSENHLVRVDVQDQPMSEEPSNSGNELALFHQMGFHVHWNDTSPKF